MLMLRFTILVIFGVVTSENYEVNSQTPDRKMTEQENVETTTWNSPDPKIDDESVELLLTRLETLCVEKLDYLVTDTNTRFQILEHQSFEVHSTVGLLVEKLDKLTTEVGRMSQSCCFPATPVVPTDKTLEVKMENLSKDIQLLMNATRILSSNVEVVKQNVSSLINNTRSVVGNSSSNLFSKPTFNKGLQKPQNVQTTASTSSPPNFTVNEVYPKNCREVRESGRNASGIYTLKPERAPKPFKAVCEMETMGGNWTVIQRRYDGSQDFYLGSQDFKNGFGNLTGEFWLGLENIHLLTGIEGNELLIELGAFNEMNWTALYSQFILGSESEKYSLKKLGAYTGNTVDSLTFSVGAKFTTKDNGAYARSHGGAWWYHGSAYSDLNGEYLQSNHSGRNDGNIIGIFWYNHQNGHKSLKYTRMLVRPKA